MDRSLRERYGSREGAEAYRTKYERSPLRRLSARREMRLVLGALAAAGTEGEVLDVPCAAGRLVPTLLERATRVTGVDLSPAMVAVAREALAGPIAAGRVLLLEGDAAALPFPDRAFDTAVCWRLLHHLTERAARVRVLSELRRVSRRAVLVSFADAGSLKARLQALRRRDRRCAKVSRDDLAAEAAEAGLSLVSGRRLSGPFSLLAAALLRPTR
jgi:ubiquinone/menaquinone biosynthesis C-methylase UbiE